MTQIAPSPAPPKPDHRPGRRSVPRVRLLPGLIFVAALMTGVRIGDLWQTLIDDPAAPLASPLAAAAQTESTPAVGEPLPLIEPREPVAEETPQAFDPDRLSAGEWDLLQQLSTRRDALDDRERSIEQREALLSVAERRVEEKVAELEALRSEIEALLHQADSQSEEQLKGLASIYEAMRPADAAAIFNGLDLEVLIAVLERMRGQKSAAVLAGMNPERARLVTTELARRRELPSLPQ